MSDKLNALIIGGSSDIGKEIIKSMMDTDEFNIYYTYNRNEISFGDGVEGIKASLDSEEGLLEFLPKVYGLDANVVVYCPGVNPSTLSKDLEHETIMQTTWINYLSAIEIFNHAIKRMLEKKNKRNKLIYISSAAAREVEPGGGLYGSNKIAVERYLASLAIEVGRFGIRTLSIAPAFIDSKMLRDYCDKSGISLNKIKKNNPTGEVLSPKDVSNTIMSFINGDIVLTGNTISIGNGEGVFK
ncbi:SDR family oxidoreductase [Vibrio mangrovi]|uniref:3-oxoacyl-[acyl-carrier-protein] reductase FabG n=1 Tax=Vibrio mangrovi TaxID=474394 RepID=A0A1Y6J245_9VIBR|nr:SDR family oxidoreductase [Vibrio mangrovi]MDW6002904.1 SDR family oxidoreductase [Vibrio mangrovi]SMS02393.1 3-oxoacyl-[acyl-carrier-protein] reductase FabG [Vibrio mangrovi]